MPWSPSQHRLFEGIAHGSIKPKDGLTKEKAAGMASEGIKGADKAKKLGAILRKK
jgi:hypothetical protein